MLKYFYILIWIAVFKLCFCQLRMGLGNESILGKKYLVYLVKSAYSEDASDDWLCAGAIVSPSQILTAAACLVEVNRIYAIAGNKKYVNGRDIEKDTCASTWKKKIVKISVPKEYTTSTAKQLEWMNVDIGVATVDEPYKFNDLSYLTHCSYEPDIIKINFNKDIEKEKTRAIALGWGGKKVRSKDGKEKSILLQEATTTIIRKEFCSKLKNGSTELVNKYLICASGNGFLGEDDDEIISNATVKEPQSHVLTDDLITINKSNEMSSRKSLLLETCQNDHGGPLITWVGAEELILGVALNGICNPNFDCVGPRIYVSTAATAKIIECLLETNDTERKTCNDQIDDKQYQIMDVDIKWPEDSKNNFSLNTLQTLQRKRFRRQRNEEEEILQERPTKDLRSFDEPEIPEVQSYNPIVNPQKQQQDNSQYNQQYQSEGNPLTMNQQINQEENRQQISNDEQQHPSQMAQTQGSLIEEPNNQPSKPLERYINQPQIESQNQPEINAFNQPPIESQNQPQVDKFNQAPIGSHNQPPADPYYNQPPIDANYNQPPIDATYNQPPKDPNYNQPQPPEMHAYNQPQTNSKQPASGNQPQMGLSNQPQMGLSNQPQMGLSNQPQMGLSNQPQMGLSNQPQMSLSNQPQMGLSNQPQMGLSNQPQMGLSNQPQMGLSNQQQMDLSNQPQIGLSNQPQMDLSNQPQIGLSNQPGINMASQNQPQQQFNIDKSKPINNNPQIPLSDPPQMETYIPSQEEPYIHPQIGSYRNPLKSFLRLPTPFKKPLMQSYEEPQVETFKKTESESLQPPPSNVESSKQIQYSNKEPPSPYSQKESINPVTAESYNPLDIIMAENDPEEEYSFKPLTEEHNKPLPVEVHKERNIKAYMPQPGKPELNKPQLNNNYQQRSPHQEQPLGQPFEHAPAPLYDPNYAPKVLRDGRSLPRSPALNPSQDGSQTFEKMFSQLHAGPDPPPPTNEETFDDIFKNLHDDRVQESRGKKIETRIEQPVQGVRHPETGKANGPQTYERQEAGFQTRQQVPLKYPQ
ncbi:hypothetical protein PYW08_009680 [Mythimna loreyi]|uniref:Uncharacterized protein n=1 Tax=Mythimna loreyi TaxID=667449 RepID=A0ACC2Q917_9NEOP|nr:hypothetical protein PYW08_009680 [Mythimna loreyi]